MKKQITLLGGLLFAVQIASAQQNTADFIFPTTAPPPAEAAAPVGSPAAAPAPAPTDANRYNNYNGKKAGKVNEIKRSAGTINMQAPSSNTINNGSDVAKDSQSSGAGMNAAVGAALMAACMASQPPAIPLCMMGAMAMMQAGEDKGAAEKSGETGFASIENSPTAPVRPEDPSGETAFVNPDVIAGYETLKKNGYDVTVGGVKNPDGSTTPLSAFNSAEGMSAAGLDPNSLKEAQKIAADIVNKMGGKVSGVPVDDGGGGGGSNSGVAEGETVSVVGYTNPFGLTAQQRKQLIAGKTVMFDGEPIGVAGNNIFEMVHSAYQSKRSRNHFIESPGAAAAPASTAGTISVRAPASYAPVNRPAQRPVK